MNRADRITLSAIGCTVMLYVSLALVGCSGKPGITEGEIVDKQHEPERQWVQIIPIITSNGKTTTTTMIPMVHYDDEDWIITIRNFTEEGDPVHRNFYVTREVYEAVHLWDYFVYEPELGSPDDPVTKERQ